MTNERDRAGGEHPLEILRVMSETGISQAEVGRALGLHKSTMTKHFKALRAGRKSTLTLEQSEVIAEHVSTRSGTEWTVDDLFAEI